MQTPLSILPDKVRAALYLALIVASAVITPLMAGGTIPSYVGSIITGLLGVFGGATALANVRTNTPAEPVND